MEEHTESWQLRSGTWYRDPDSETWHLAASPNGTAVNVKLSTQDVGRMIGARRDISTGQWFPSDFNYSPQTGTPLQDPVTCLDSPWVPPFGAPALSDMTRPPTRGLRQTPAQLTLARSNGRLDPDRTLPALPPGHYRFLVDKFDVASSTLMAIEPEQGKLLVLLPESKIWSPLERPAGGILAQGLKNFRGWRMEVVEGVRGATLYFPTAIGLAVVTPTLIGLSYAVEYFGEGPALGGPVAWAGEVWLPVLGKNGAVNLVGKPPGAAEPIVLPTSVLAPKNGYEAPVFDPHHVIWPSEEGQLIVRLDQTGKKKAEWIAWPDGLRPTFSLGCPLLFGFFWQQCWRGQDESLEYVQMGKLFPERAAIDAPRLCTGHVSYKNEQRIEGDPWMQPEHVSDGTSSTIVVPLLESELEHAVVGLRIDAPQGVLALLESDQERHRAVLQLQAENRADALFGTLSVARPWLTSLFVYDAHLWVYHPELAQAYGWKLESRIERPDE
ncbi:hypothetical protein [Caenimonas soli]|uniref:hypothetical protein n=1 Tax=Caenimonas soli TaxID=2735555 RepID=UPI0015540496|nr:hypothetical protein [Caenimonas soli]NPC55889.1 hypothetical protein [Caenimonas soli]